MPAYDRPIEFRRDSTAAASADSIAAMIKFKCPATEAARVHAFIHALVERGIVEYADVKVYDSSVTSPVLYFP